MGSNQSGWAGHSGLMIGEKRAGSATRDLWRIRASAANCHIVFVEDVRPCFVDMSTSPFQQGLRVMNVIGISLACALADPGGLSAGTDKQRLVIKGDAAAE